MKTTVNSVFTHRHRALAFIVCILLLPTFAAAQNHSILYETPDDVKHYTTKIIPDGSGSVMAGTILKSLSGGQNAIHFIRQDNVGNVIVSRQYNSGYTDERAVDIVGYEDGLGVTRWYITCLSRDAATTRDRIKVICVNNNGLILGQRTYHINVSGPGGTPVFQLYPMNSLIWHPNEQDMSLFICGYTKFPGFNDPTYDDTKYGFVVKIDITQGPTHLNEYPTGHLYGSTRGPQTLKDYDMATRMVQVEGSDNIFVTGAVNSTSGTGGFPNVYNHHSAVMNLVIDPITLMPIYYHPFTPGEPNGDLNNEGALCYGVDLIQSNGQNYVLFNMSGYGTYPWVGVTPSDMWPRYSKIWAIAPLNGPMDPFDYSSKVYAYGDPNRTWASKAFEVNGQAIIATQSAFDFLWCDNGSLYPWRPDFWNVVSGLMTVNLSNLSGTGLKFYLGDNLTNFQTGDPAAGINNSFWEAGGVFSNIDYPPAFADMYSDGTFAMNSPRHLNNMLYIKYQNPDPSLNIDCGTYSCGKNLLDIDNRPASSTLEHEPFNIISIAAGAVQNSVGSTYSIINGLPCEDANGNPHWKTTGIEEANITPGGINIYPNPASTEVHIALGNAFAGKDATIQVELANAMGQVVTSLYNGKADGLTTSKALPLPHLAGGIYTVKITSNGEVKYNGKLTIQ